MLIACLRHIFIIIILGRNLDTIPTKFFKIERVKLRRAVKSKAATINIKKMPVADIGKVRKCGYKNYITEVNLRGFDPYVTSSFQKEFYINS